MFQLKILPKGLEETNIFCEVGKDPELELSARKGEKYGEDDVLVDAEPDDEDHKSGSSDGEVMDALVVENVQSVAIFSIGSGGLEVFGKFCNTLRIIGGQRGKRQMAMIPRTMAEPPIQ